jgi:hypothetical protein
MPELVITIWMNDSSMLPFIEWDGLIGTDAEIEKYKENLESWMTDWTPGNLIRLETDKDTYYVKYDAIDNIQIFVRQVR